ncbi:pentatricopeptide repeat-containing protein, partial [Trifolium medium]|nr:pentatricopeptide repeat-containing protein [Trifolium medium]
MKSLREERRDCVLSINEDGEIIALETQEVEEDEEVEAECKVIGVLGSMGEFNTMKLEDKLQNIEVVVLVDSGASHNFISSKLATALELPITH